MHRLKSKSPHLSRLAGRMSSRRSRSFAGSRQSAFMRNLTESTQTNQGALLYPLFGSPTFSLYVYVTTLCRSISCCHAVMLPCLARQAMIHDMLSKLQEQQAQDSRRDAWCKAEVASTRQSKAAAPNTTLPCRLRVIACHLDACCRMTCRVVVETCLRHVLLHLERPARPQD